MPPARQRATTMQRRASRSFLRSLQPLCRFLNDAQVRIFLHVDTRLGEAELAGKVDVLLQRVEVRHQVRIVIDVPVGESPIEGVRRTLDQIAEDLLGGLVIRGVEIPVHDAQRVFHEIDHRGPVLVEASTRTGPRWSISWKTRCASCTGISTPRITRPPSKSSAIWSSVRRTPSIGLSPTGTSITILT